MIIFVAILITCLAFYSIHSSFKYTRMIANIFLGLVYRPDAEQTQVARGQKVQILDSSDHEIDALFVEQKNSRHLVIFCHESGSGVASWEKYAYFLPDNGFSLLSVELLDSQETSDKNSLSQWPTDENVERLLTAIRWSKKAVKDDISIILFGVSHGANVALAASLREPLVKAVIADGLFSMKEIFRDYIRKWAPILVKPNLFGENYPDWVVNLFTNLGFWYCQRKSGKKFINVEKLLQKKHVPLFMIHGQEDDYVCLSHQTLLHKLDRFGKSIHLSVAKARHNESIVLEKETYQNNILKFLKDL